ncbi:exonuclease domain-containing protein, partial [Corynebacterium afermentans]
MPCEPVFAVIDTETTGFNKRYDRIIGLAAVRADANFNPVDSWHTLLTPDTNAV